MTALSVLLGCMYESSQMQYQKVRLFNQYRTPNKNGITTAGDRNEVIETNKIKLNIYEKFNSFSDYLYAFDRSLSSY